MFSPLLGPGHYKNTSNISILMADYHDLCIEVMTNVERSKTV